MKWKFRLALFYSRSSVQMRPTDHYNYSKKSNLQQTSRQLGASPGKNWSDYQVHGVEGQGNVATNMEILWIVNRWRDLNQNLHKYLLDLRDEPIRFSRSLGQRSGLTLAKFRLALDLLSFYLSVATSRKNLWLVFPEKCARDVFLDKKELFKCCKSSASGSGSRKFCGWFFNIAI